MFHFFPSQNLCDENRPCNKLDEGQPKVMIYTNYDGSESLMLHTKLLFEKKKIFLGFYNIMGMKAILVM